ncbi:MAG: TlpA family protein disulfide reductase [Sumerlaeia bacterium]
MKTLSTQLILFSAILFSACSNDQVLIESTASTTGNHQKVVPPIAPALQRLKQPIATPVDNLSETVDALKQKLSSTSGYTLKGYWSKMIDNGELIQPSPFTFAVRQPNQLYFESNESRLSRSENTFLLTMKNDDTYAFFDARGVTTPSLLNLAVPPAPFMYPWGAALDVMTNPSVLDSATLQEGNAISFANVANGKTSLTLNSESTIQTFSLENPDNQVHLIITEAEPRADVSLFSIIPPENGGNFTKQFQTMAYDFEQKKLIGKPAPDFELTSIAGETVRLSELKGNVIILDFWATWCPPCIEALPKMQNIQTKYADKPLKIITMNLDPEENLEKAVKPLLERKGIDSLTVLIGNTDEPSSQYAVNQLPHVVLINADGIVERVFVGYEMTEFAMEQILADYI